MASGHGHVLSWKQKGIRQRFETSPRTSLLGCAALSSLVLIVNIGVISWASTCSTSDDRTQILYEGGCSTVSKANIAAHVAINLLGTLLLGASNYSMQIAIAPSRADVDKAHSKRRALTIGVPSLRNIRSISSPRRVCWAVLALSSIPLHLLYNSSILSTKIATEYMVAELDQSFLRTGPSTELSLNQTIIESASVPVGIKLGEVKGLFDRILAEAHTWENLTVEQCAQAYSPYLLSSRRTLVLVTAPSAGTKALPGQFRFVGSRTWMCDAPDGVIAPDRADASGSLAFPCNPERAMFGYRRSKSRVWKTPIHPLYCLAEPHPETCRLEASQPFLGVVCAFNALKVLGMLWVYSNASAKEPKMNTLGDAIASFLENPDDSTRGLSALDRNVLERNWRACIQETPVSWTRRSYRRLHAVSSTQHAASIALFSTVIAAMVVFLGMAWAADSARGTLSSVFNPSSFTTNENLAIVGFESLQHATLSGLVLLVNTPQLVFSVVYVYYNALLSSFLQASEWNAFSLVRKTLRVSNAQAPQRSSFWLQVPARYSIPLLLFSSAMHFLISQALSLSRITFFNFLGGPSDRFGGLGYGNMYGEHPGQLLSAIYFTPAILAVLILSVAVLLALVAIAAKRLPGNMVMAAASSAAIAAACHDYASTRTNASWKGPHIHTRADIATGALMWGDVGAVQQGQPAYSPVRHLQFSAENVTEPGEGAQYA